MSHTIDDMIAMANARRAMPSPANRRLIREQAGLSQQNIGDAVGVSRAAVSRWELGEREPRGAAFRSYVHLLDRLQREVLAP